MADYTARSSVILNGKQAEDQLLKLGNRAKQLSESMKKLRKANDLAGFNKQERELKQVNKEMRQMRQEAFSVENVLKKLSGASLKEVSAAARKANAELKVMKGTDPGFKLKSQQVQMLNARMKELTMHTRAQQSLLSRVTAGFNKYSMMIAAGAAAFAGLFLAMRKTIDSFNEFEETVSNLSALTGLGVEEMKYLEDQAKKTSAATIEGGVRIKQSAKDIVDAYTMVGSKRPELLKNKEALHQVTQEAIILSEAAKMDLGPAAGALAIPLNQFQLSASDARMVINSLAAGSQAGAGNIEYLSQAIEKAGTTANLMGLSVEQTIGAIETLAPFFSQASEAGNTLDKTMLMMRKRNIGYQSGVFDLNDAIKELEHRFANGQTAVDLFGVRHAKSAELLVLNRKEFLRYTSAVTGTSKAIEQASTNTDNNNAKIAQAKNRIALVRMELGEKLGPAYVSVISKSRLMLKLISSLINLFTKHGQTILIAVAGIIAYNAAIKLAAGWTKITGVYLAATTIVQNAYTFSIGVLTGKIKLATAAQRIWNLVQTANPIGLLVGILVSVGTALHFYSKRLTALAKAQKELNEVEKTAQKGIVEQKLRMEELLAIARNENFSLEKRKKALGELNVISPEYFGNLKLERVNTEDATTAAEAYTEALLKQARVQAAKEKLAELEKNRIDDMYMSGEESAFGAKWHQSTLNYLTSFGNAVSFGYKQAVTGAGNAAKAEDVYIYKKVNVSAALEFQKEEQESHDPALEYAMEQYRQTLEYKLALNESMHASGLIGEQQYQDSLTELVRQAEEQRFDIQRSG